MFLIFCNLPLIYYFEKRKLDNGIYIWQPFVFDLFFIIIIARLLAWFYFLNAWKCLMIIIFFFFGLFLGLVNSVMFLFNYFPLYTFLFHHSKFSILI